MATPVKWIPSPQSSAFGFAPKMVAMPASAGNNIQALVVVEHLIGSIRNMDTFWSRMP